MAHDLDGPSADSAHLRAEIRETRERMSETLDQLGTRLNPDRIRNQVRENIREATVGRVENMARHAADRVNDTRDGILDTIRDNPIPAALVGIGLGWMLFNGRRDSHSSRRVHGYAGTGYLGDISATTPRLRQDEAAGGIGASVSSYDEPGVIDRVRDTVASVGSSTTERVSDVAGRTREVISDVAGTTQEKIGDVAHRVQHVASDVRETARTGAYRVEDRFQQTLQDNPFAIGAAAIAIGMAAGFAIPETRRESQLMGGKRDELVGRVREAAQEAREKVQHVAERVVDETRVIAKDAAREEGLVS
jgi:ElaB/YqjD/DUF883 family membrane-anchored ribosome-binding protein